MAEVAFDTHKAVKELCSAGFDDTQAEALVEQINGAFVGSVATKADVERLVNRDEFRDTVATLATREEIAKLATREEIARLVTRDEFRDTVATLATREEIAKLATKEEIARLVTRDEFRDTVATLATKEEIAKLATKEEIAKLATKEELEKLELNMVVLLQQQANTYLRYLLLTAAAIVAASKAWDFLVA